MPTKLNDMEYLTDKIFQRVDQLMTERNLLKHELARISATNIEHEKNFVLAYQSNLTNIANAADKITRLEHILNQTKS